LIIGVVLIRMVYQFDRSDQAVHWMRKLKYPLSVVFIGLLAVMGTPPVSAGLGSHYNVDMKPILSTQLNAADRENQFNGYYESILLGNTLIETPLEQIERRRPDEWKQLHTLDALNRTDDLILKWLKPNLDIMFKGARFQTNDKGLRDRPVSYENTPGTLRMILLGGSIEMGTGVTTEQTYENLVEDRLTAKNVFSPYEEVEIVNFGISGVHLPQQIARVDSIVPMYQPQVVIYTCHSDEIGRLMANLYRLYMEDLHVKYRFLNQLFADLNLPATVDEATFKRALRPRIPEVIEWGLNYIKQETEAMGAVPIWMFVPSLDGKVFPKQDEQLYQQAIGMGFHVLDLRGFNGNVQEEELILGSWDRHPNSYGHELLAMKMYKELIKNKELLNQIIDTYPNQQLN